MAADDWAELAERVDDMNAILAEELGLDPVEMREAPPKEALALLSERIDAHRVRPEQIDNWRQMCAGSADHRECFRSRVQKALDEPTPVATVVITAAVISAGAAFALSWLRK